MKKLILIGLLLIPLVYAIDENDTITQQQLNNVQLDNLNLTELVDLFKCQMEDFGSIYHNNETGYWMFKKEYSCLTTYDREEPYLIVRELRGIHIRWSSILSCELTYGVAYCQPAIDLYFKSRARTDIRGLQTRMKRLQRDTSTPDASDYIGGGVW